MHMRWIPLALGILMTAATVILQLHPPAPLQAFLKGFDYMAYDLRMELHGKPDFNKDESPIVIIAVDEKSLKAEGRWPWPRKRTGDLVENLFNAGAVLVAFDVLFIEPEKNIAQHIIDTLPDITTDNTELATSLASIKSHFNSDERLAEALKKGDTILSVFFINDADHSKGVLIEPLVDISETPRKELMVVPDMKHYLGNIEVLQKSATSGGFVTTIPDDDGIVRRVPLLMRHQDKLYAGLSLEIVRQYLLLDDINVDFDQLNDLTAVRNIQLGNINIPTNEAAQMTLPFVGKAFTLPYLSATDVLHNQLPKEALAGKIAIIGASAIGIGDVHGTPLQHAGYPGVEVHANAVIALLTENFLVTPVWVLGLQVVLTITLGLLASIFFSRMSLWTLFISLWGAILALLGLNTWLWIKHSLVVSEPIMAILLICAIAVTNVSYRMLFENRQRRKLNDMFGQYVPKDHIKDMMGSKGSFGLEGESREMSVLFSDIRNFTSISEKLSAQDVKKMLNALFTPVTKLIFEHQGTIDKYVGDMVMAFWGAPAQDPEHAEHAVRTALSMLKTIKDMQKTFAELGLSEVKVGIGINSGQMNVGDMGSEFRRSYTVLGDEVNLGSRLESITKFYHVNFLISGATEKACPDLISRHLDLIRVKGKETAVDIYEPLGFSDDTAPELKAEVSAHNQALKAYLAQDWASAQASFTELQKKNPDYYAYQMYLERIEAFKENPPNKDWDGVFTHKEK